MKLILLATLAMLALPALGRDLTGKWAQSPNRDWFNSLKSRHGFSCCSNAEGLRLDDVDWRRTDNPELPYQVMIDGEWRNVPEDTVVDATNKVGYAMVWPIYLYLEDGKTRYFSHVRCFMPGTEI